MRTIELDDDVFFYLQGMSHARKLTIAEILREKFSAADRTRDANAQEEGKQLSPRDRALREFVKSPGYLSNRSVVEQFLSVWSFLHNNNPDRFKDLEVMEGRKRKYIAKSEQELENSGTSVNPKRIPQSNFWVVTNNDTLVKKKMLKRGLELLGYNAVTIRLVTDSLR
jgi:negative modulator of initiation of replication